MDNTPLTKAKREELMIQAREFWASPYGMESIRKAREDAYNKEQNERQKEETNSVKKRITHE